MRVPRRRWIGPVAVAACVGILAGVLAASSRETRVIVPHVAAPVGAAPAVVEGEWPESRPRAGHQSSFVVADAIGPQVPLYSAPGEALDRSLDNPTWEGLPVVFLVLETRGQWHHVRVSSRPNGMTAWIRRSDVTVRRVPNWIKVEVGARRLTVFHADTALMSTTVAVGREGTPTPTGSFFVDGIVRLDPPHRAYGNGQVSVAAFSPTLESFGGGIGQIALHGTFATSLLGQSTSNGCVRLDNDSISRVMDLAPTGTPVEIVA